MARRPPLPIDAELDRIQRELAHESLLVIQAPPGTGKTTRVPPALLESPWMDGRRVLLLEPRQIAARAAAERIASEMGTTVGDQVGLRTRLDTRTGPNARIEVLTEGVLTRMLLSDPGLSEASVVVFDEFHERSIHADTAFAFTRETVDALRPDLRVVLMSATIDRESLFPRLGSPPTIAIDVSTHPVETVYRAPAPGRSVDDEVPDAVVDVLAAHEGDVLVFMAGAAAINRAVSSLTARVPRDVVVTPLHGSLDPAAQDRALSPDPNGRRKVVLATPIAETSVTIDGVRVVVDTGLRRRPEHDVGRGMSQLRTVQASRAATDQRRGRAGRQGPGLCVRLWPEVDQARRRADEPPEVLTADLTALALDIAAWGAREASELPWIDEPAAPALAAARGILTRLGALDDERRLTPHGQAMAQLGTEPRLAHLLIEGVRHGHGPTACAVAALLSERDPFRGRSRPSDVRLRIDALATTTHSTDRDRVRRIRELASRWHRRLEVADGPVDPDVVGPLVSLAFPERIAQRRAENGQFLLASGAGASLPPDDGLAAEPYLAVAETDGMGAEARIVLAAPISRSDIERLHGDAIEHAVRGEWDRRRRDAVFEHQDRFGALVLRREPDAEPDQRAVTEALLAGVRREGLSILEWSDADDRRRARLQFLHELDPASWPSFDDATLLEELETWLGPQLGRARNRKDLSSVNVAQALDQRLDWRQSREVDQLAPSHYLAPSGSRLPIDYSAPSAPLLAVRLQEMFGLTVTPTVGGGRVPLVVHLLSPAHRPVQVTSDLASFWREGYQDVRKELRGRYPKHEWPEDPTSAPPTRRAKSRRR